MSYNQSRSDRNDSSQYRRSGGRSNNTFINHQHPQRTSSSSSAAPAYGKGAGTASAPAPSPSPLSCNRSFKKSNNGQGGQSRVSSNIQNGAHQPPPPQSQGAADAAAAVASGAATSNPTELSSSSRRSNRAIPKAPASQRTSVTCDNNEPRTPSKAPGDASIAFAFQFGSLSPGFMNGIQIPARTSSAPPNLDEQKRAQARHDSLRSVPDTQTPVPKQNKDADQSTEKETHPTAKEKRDVHVSTAPSACQTPKSPAVPIRMSSMQSAFRPPQVSSVQFGGPNLHIQSQNVAATSLQMPMPMHIPMGNVPQMQQQVFVPMPHQGMMHQGQGLSFTTPMGAQLPPQVGHMAMGMTPQYPQQQGRKFGGTRKTTPVKITHPDTHEELRLDKRADSSLNGGSSGPRPYHNIAPQSQPVPGFTHSHPINYYHSPYNAGSAFFPQSSLPLTSGQMAPNSSATRFSYPVTQGSHNVPLTNPSAHSLGPLVRPGATAHSVPDSSHSTNVRETQSAVSSAPSGTTKVTVKPATVSEKVGSPRTSRSLREVSEPLAQNNVEVGSEKSSQQLNPGKESAVPKSLSGETKQITVGSDALSPAAAAFSGENVPAFPNTEGTKGGNLSRPTSIKDHQEKPGETVIGISETIDAKAATIPLTDGFKEPPGESLSTIYAPASNTSDSKAEGIIEESTRSSETSTSSLQDKGVGCDNRGIGEGEDIRLSGKRMEDSKPDEISTEQHAIKSAELVNHVDEGSNLNVAMDNNEFPSTGTIWGELDNTSSVGEGSERISDGISTSNSWVLHSREQQTSSVPFDLSETALEHEGEGAERVDNGSTSVPISVSKDKSSQDSSLTRTTSSRGKTKRKEILQKADAAGATSDLYMAYKGPEEKKEMAMPLQTTEAVSAVIDVTQVASDALQVDAIAIKEVEQSKAELEDWEDAADIPTPRLETPYDIRDGYGSMAKKYSRDFLLKFADQCTGLPEGCEIPSDIADGLINAHVGASHPLDRDSFSSPGRVIDRQGSATRSDRRAGSMVVDDRWSKSAGSFGSGRDVRLDIGYGGNVGFRPAQGGNSSVLRNPRGQAPIVSRPMQPTVRNSSDADRWQRATNFQQKGLIPAPQTPLQMMHKAEKKYEVGKVSDEEEAKQRRLKAILNKLTPQNFEKLFEQVKEVNIDNADTLTGVISQIFDKALMEPTFCEMYADFCLHLSTELPDFTENNKKITFKRVLLNKCQEEFERGEREEEEANKVEEGEVKQTDEEREEKRLKARRRMLGNIRLIGELYKKKMLTERIMHECIKKLLGHHQDPDEENIEALCKLMSTIGEMIDHPKAKVHMDAYFERMTMLSNNTRLSSRVRFMLRDAIDLRKNKWQQRRKVEGPKKIEEVHRDAAQERQTQGSRLARGPSINSSARKGPADFGPRGGPTISSANSQMGSFRGLAQVRGFGTQDIRFEDRQPYEARTLSVPLPQRSFGDDSITLGPQGGLGKVMSIRGPPVSADISLSAGDSRRTAAGLNGFGPDRFAASAANEPPTTQERGLNYGSKDLRNSGHASDQSIGASPAMQGQGSSAMQNVPSQKFWPEERLRDMSMSAIKEFYSAVDEKEVALCIKDLNSPSFHPTMIYLWITDSFERKDFERNLLANLLMNLVKSPNGILSQTQLVKGFESVLATLEDAVNDAPRAAEFLGRIFGKAIVENVISLEEIGRLIREGGEETGCLLEFGLAGDVLGSTLEMVQSEGGDATLNEIRQNSGLRLEDFRPPDPNRSRILEKFI